MEVLKVSSAEFKKEVLESEIPVLVDFYADWCGPCKMMSPIIEEIAENLNGKVKIAKINVDAEADLAIEYEVSSIPTFLLIKNGQVVTNIIGMRDKKYLEEKITNNI